MRPALSRLCLALLIGAIDLCAPAPARATVTEPNTVVVPLDSKNGEVQLYTLFPGRGETIDWKADAFTEPAVFSPLCGFTAELVLRETASHLAVGWYNVIPAATMAPAVSDIHVVVPVDSPVGLKITGADIRKDPAYAGGLIGFALVGSQPHYTERKWSVSCTACAMPGPWALSLTYVSKKTPNAFYIAFEDGPVTNSSFNNDGDFNDYVFYFEGLSCVGAGQPCDTGQSGVCGQGLLSCGAGGVLGCQQVNLPATEKCDGLDNDCNGKIDDNAPCPAGYTCDRGLCVSRCDTEFPCPAGFTCQGSVCIETPCAGKTCAAGQLCRGGTCQGPCSGITCPGTSVCRLGRCVDPCAGVTCAAGNVCSSGVCVIACSCLPCTGGLSCQSASGLCVDPGCVNMTCGAGTVCQKGACVPACQGAVCPAGQTCNAGAGTCQDIPPDMAPPARDLSQPADLAQPDLSIIGSGGAIAVAGCNCQVGRPASAGLPAAAAYAVGIGAVGLLLLRRRRRGAQARRS